MPFRSASPSPGPQFALSQEYPSWFIRATDAPLGALPLAFSM